MRCNSIDLTAWRGRAVRFVIAVVVLSSMASSARAASLCGKWEGRWKSCTDHFEGTVNAKITRCGCGKYKAVFTGRAFKIMPYRYTAILTAHKDPATGIVHFKCTRKIPFWGCYWMNGTATNCCFKARYRTDDHTGIFVMRRVD